MTNIVLREIGLLRILIRYVVGVFYCDRVELVSLYIPMDHLVL